MTFEEAETYAMLVFGDKPNLYMRVDQRGTNSHNWNTNSKIHHCFLAHPKINRIFGGGNGKLLLLTDNCEIIEETRTSTQLLYYVKWELKIELP